MMSPLLEPPEGEVLFSVMALSPYMES
jgi:hypothetical protein